MQFLSSTFNVLLIILGFTMLIFIHELGHFIAAKWARIRTEAFAVGMGPVMIAWRKGIGLRLGSTTPEYERRVRDHLKSSGAHINPKTETESAALPQAEMYRIGDQLGLGETEYSLRWLPIGGFVKMLGQEDANPNYVSNDPRSYTMRPVGKRMIVVSAGVIMNIILAVILFIIAFMVGVRFEAPVIGDVSSELPAGRTMPDNAQSLGIAESGLQPGDVVTHIDGKRAVTFADLQIASAMSKPGVPVKLTVNRPGLSSPAHFTLLPEKDPASGLLSIGVAPGSSAILLSQEKDADGLLSATLEHVSLAKAGVKPGMRMIRANGQPVRIFEQFQQQVRQSGGNAISTEWADVDGSGQPADEIVRAQIAVEPSFAVLRYGKSASDELQNIELGLFGMTPLVKLEEIPPGPNAAILKKGDVVLRADSIEAPRMADFRREVNRHARGAIELLLLRDGQEAKVTAQVDRKGKLNVMPSYAWDLPMIAQPMHEVRLPQRTANGGRDEAENRATPVADLRLFGRTRIDAVGAIAVRNWADIRREFRAQTEKALAEKSPATVALTTTLPTPGAERETVEVQLSAEDIAALHELSWQTSLPPYIFEPIYTVRTAQGNPLKAVTMGFEETYKLVMMTYLTIDRLIRGSVGVEQLRGPVGIVHIGSKVADRGFTYLIFFLAMISVNLAVINFLPIPIVDGGLFLFLIYEKFKGRPPSLAFQNAATIAGLFLIGTAFVVTFYNDVLRLLS